MESNGHIQRERDQRAVVLFVDDDPLVLQGLRRQLRPLRRTLELLFATSGEEALAVMDEAKVDVLVADLRMPGMDGASLLEVVKERHPATMRVVLSGQASEEATMRVLRTAHQFLDKPCDVRQLYAVLQRAIFVKKLMNSPRLQALVAGMESIPSLPEIYTRIQELLEDPDCSVEEVARLVGQDVAMSAKLLQLVNSAFFGHYRPVETPEKAVHLLGLETVKALVLSIHLFSQLELDPSYPLSIRAVWRHSLWVGSTAKHLCHAEGLDEAKADCAFLAGLLHDVGKAILAANLPEDHLRAIEMARKEGELYRAEQRVFGAGHPEVGAYLLGLWGLPGPAVEVVAYHHRPHCYPATSFDPFTAVYVANILDHQLGATPGQPGASTQLDMAYLERIGCDERVGRWTETAREFLPEDRDEG